MRITMPDVTARPDNVEDASADPVGPPELRPRKRWMLAALRLESVMNQRSRSPAAKRWLLGIALVLFAVVSVISFVNLPDDVQLHWWVALLLVFVTTPLTVVANAGEYRVMAAISGHRVSWLEAGRLTVLATAANLLPVPGGIMVRTQALRAQGTTYRRALAANAASGIAWVAVGSFATGTLLIWRPGGADCAVPVLHGIALIGFVSVWLLLRRANRGLALRHFSKLLIVELATVVISSVRIYLAFQVLGQTIAPAQAVALSASMILAAAIGIFPAGLGLREVLAGIIGVAVGLSASESVAATAVDRIAAQIGLVILAAVLLGTVRGRKTPDSTSLPAADPDDT